ncbi:MAG: helix-turn-helix domain-containing protein [Xanthomonadales bacterium]|jgi:Fis family transcriptional regulator|nr:helix-turn-helix domain-containing protein [Xanthomonadales bacterium]
MSTAKTPAAVAATDRATPLRKYVQRAIQRYLVDMGGSQPDNLYRTLMSQVEPPLIEEVLKHTGGNQSRAARILGMTRNTLRSKIKHYDITPGSK